MIEVIYEDNHLIVVNKRSGDIVQGDKTGDEPLSDKVKKYIKEKYNKPGEVFLGVVHRIDRPVSGVVIFARTSKALARMNAMFQSKEIQKTYWAVVKNKPMNTEELVVRYLTKNEKQNKSYCSKVPKEGAFYITLSGVYIKTTQQKWGFTLLSYINNVIAANISIRHYSNLIAVLGGDLLIMVKNV